MSKNTNKLPLLSDNPTNKEEDEDLTFCQRLCKSGCKGKNAKVIFYSIGLLFTAVGNSIFLKKMLNKFPNYPYFLSQFTTFVFVPVFFLVVLYEFHFTNLITEEMTLFPKRKFFWMGAFDGLASVFLLFGGVHTSGSTQALLNNAVIPVTMVLSYFVLKMRYKPLQVLGATLIMCGIGVVILPNFFDSKKSSGDQPLFIVIYVMFVIPQAMSSIYKEVAFKDADIDINYLQAWVALWQLVFGLFLIPLNTLKFLGDNYLSWSELPNAIKDGLLCLGGTNTIKTNCWVGDSVDGMKQCDDCSGAFLPLMLYLIFNLAYNVFITLVIKYGGAALMYIIMTVRLPLVQIAFSMAFIQDPPDKLQWYSFVGLALILIGLIGYRWASIKKGEEEAEKAKEAEEKPLTEITHLETSYDN